MLVIDVGHEGYISRYPFNTLRCVACEASVQVRQPAAVILWSWMYAATRPSCSWSQPEKRMTWWRVAGADGGDLLDLFDVNLGEVQE